MREELYKELHDLHVRVKLLEERAKKWLPYLLPLYRSYRAGYPAY
jgi:hypothetical protein